MLQNWDQYQAELDMVEKLQQRLSIPKDLPPYIPGVGAILEPDLASMVGSAGVVGAMMGSGLAGAAIGTAIWGKAGDYVSGILDRFKKNPEQEKKRLLRSVVPGRRLVETVQPMLVDDFVTWCRWEQSQKPDEDHCHLVLVQATKLEAMLRRILLEETSDIADHVLAAQKKNTGGRRILERFFSGDMKPTLGVVELFAVSLRRLLADQNPDAVSWVNQRFQAHVRRWPEERLTTVERLSQRSFPRFIGKLRNSRNPLAHGDEVFISQEQYRAFCDLAWASSPLTQWWETGTNPVFCQPKNIGWMSLLLAARKEAEGCIPRA